MKTDTVSRLIDYSINRKFSLNKKMAIYFSQNNSVMAKIIDGSNLLLNKSFSEALNQSQHFTKH